MFTGIIERTGTILERDALDGGGARLTVDTLEMSQRIHPGDSVAVNGVCLTAVSVNGTVARFDLAPETLRRTSFSRIQPGHEVNLELPLTPSSLISGHFVQGHVDGVARVNAWKREGEDVLLQLQIPDDLLPFCVHKGSIAVNGVSLTIASLWKDLLEIALIPFTLQKTNLGKLQLQDEVNIETDILGKYVVSLTKKEYHL